MLGKVGGSAQSNLHPNCTCSKKETTSLPESSSCVEKHKAWLLMNRFFGLVAEFVKKLSMRESIVIIKITITIIY
jgi:hypothetical protein